MTRRALPFSARAVAARTVAEVLAHGRYLDTALSEALAGLPAAGAREAPLIQEMAYGTLRWFHELAGIAHLFLDKPFKPKDQDVYALLLVGLYQLRHMRIASHAAVNETVNAAEALGKPWVKGLLNACLRAALRETDRVRTALATDESLRLSHPRWLIERIRATYPDAWERILSADNERPPLTLRVNLARVARSDYLARLAQAGIAAEPTTVSDAGVVLAQGVAVEDLPGFADGLVSVQDEAAQLAAILLDVHEGARVLDACAAPGGKTTHTLERVRGLTVVAVDREAARVALVRENLARLRLDARLITADASEPADWWDGKPFDRILVDAPCSATGIIRRHPDIKVRRRPEDLPRLAATQAKILDGVWPLLKRGGKLLYVTCSILPDENEQQLEAFLARRPDAREARLALPAGTPRRRGVQILPGEKGMDGFYYAALEKP